jgi:hypothetical protein
VRIDRSVDYDRRWVREQRQQFLKQKVWTLHVRVERSVKCRRVPLADWLQFGDPRIDKEDVQLSECLSDFVGNFALLRRVSRVGLDDSDKYPKSFVEPIDMFVGCGRVTSKPYLTD